VCDYRQSFVGLAFFFKFEEKKSVETKLYVGNLSYDTTEDDLRTLFTQAGTVSSVALIKDRDTNRSKGFAFVEMSSQSEAEEAIKLLNGSTFGNRPLTVNIARPREERPTSGYGSRPSYNNNRGDSRGRSKRGTKRY
jgi:RNA recognition motif-containing protein